MSKEIEIETPARRAIELDGIHGTFRIEKCAFAIHYFSTYATPDASAEEEHYRDLLEELKPMRERVPAKELTDLNALLQRDLSDERIATELVPYLCGKASKVGFFPPVLAVLVPSGFIDKKPTSVRHYPVSTSSAKGDEYGSLWRLQYHVNSKRLGRLSIFAGTEIIVLDGQHRANAFRYVSGVLKPDLLHAVFYEHAPRPVSFASDLPVTIVWFEALGQQKVQPNDISRELFVAVNNNAKTVSQSRTILLDDTDPVCLAVNTYYAVLAKRKGFRTGGMNLLCACFDVDIDEAIANSRPVFALTDPVSLKSATTYAFFGLDKYDTLERSKANRMPQTNKSRVERLCGPVSYIDTGAGRRIQPVVDLDQRANFRSLVEEYYVPILDSVFEGSRFAESHHEAVKETEDWVRSPDCGATIADTWDRIFCGGEGLFGQIQQSQAEMASGYKKSIREIQEKFRNIRCVVVRKALGSGAKFTEKEINKAFELFDTVACQTGIVMALSVLGNELHRKRVRPAARTKRICEKVCGISLRQWLTFFITFEKLYFSDLDANSWPRFQKLFVRIFCKKEIDVFEKHPERSPEWEIVAQRSCEIVLGLADAGRVVKAKDGDQAVAAALKEIKKAFGTMGEDVLAGSRIKKHAKAAVGALLRKLEKERTEVNASESDERTDDESDEENGIKI